jgi:hypothetical protein
MIVLYLWYTVRATDWRIGIRRTMNESDTDANTKAIDSLLNYETVKILRRRAAGGGPLRPLHGRLTSRPASRATPLSPSSTPGRP